MGKPLLVVESPTKVRTIRRYLGDKFAVAATMGHVKDLPASKLGVDVDREFAPQYVKIKGREKVLAAILKAARGAEAIYLAPDPDREGEAIAYHVAEELRDVGVPVHRVLFHEITRQGIEKGLAEPRAIDRPRFESQQARRILDRLVGYELSPVLWKKVQRGLSAGRVQSVAVRLIVERERAVRGFVPQEYWQVFATLAPSERPEGGAFRAQLTRIDGETPKIGDAALATRVREELERSAFRAAKLEEKTRSRRPLPPYITSRLQQDASARFHFAARRTMQTAQQLYEGVEIGNGGPTGLITYMRTDSTRVSETAVAACREFVGRVFGAEALPARPNVYASRAGAQDAHEAIRPTDVGLTPDKVGRHLTPDQAKVYGLIWRRFVASQMKPAVYAINAVEVEARPEEPAGRTYRLRATCSRLAEPGWLAVYGEEADAGDGPKGPDGDSADAARVGGGAAKGPANGDDSDTGCAAAALPALRSDEPLRLVPPGVAGEQKFTQPPARFTEGSLVREMEELGIGRPSTYASIVSTILQRRYVRKVEQKLQPTELGELVTDRLIKHFPKILDPQFTARMEEELDRVEGQQVDWHALLAEFYAPFHTDVQRAMREMVDVRSEKTETDEKCERCGAPLVRRWGRAGWFLACSTYPKCNFSKDVPGADGTPAARLPDVSGETCAKCGKPMVVRRGRFGAFLACTGYPACKTTRPLPTGVKCPRPGCGGDIVERRTRNGKNYWECSKRVRVRPPAQAAAAEQAAAPAKTSAGAKGKAAKGKAAKGKAAQAAAQAAAAAAQAAAAAAAPVEGCDFVTWRRPVPQPCPRCGAPYLVEARVRGVVVLVCDDKECGYRATPVTEGEAPAAE
ncbi:MAG: type I DNA topoisomerase [Deltaproteobacteria bacterium]|nr:type I DNA topoisomerase [Deltaproteobacteria bacterium]